MKAVDFNEAIPIRMWVEPSELDTKAVEQTSNLANHPFAVSHVALMPDAHGGYGMPIGGVFATQKVVVPNAVGVDIGCGMTSVQLPITDIDQDVLKYIMNMIRKDVPVGYKKNSHGNDDAMPEASVGFYPIVEREYENASKSLGTLGGGNHFIEFQKGNGTHVYVMLHSGSRNLGKQVAEHYNQMAEDENENLNKIKVPKNHELAYLYLDDCTGQDYLREMKYCIEFAKASRNIMMKKILHIIYGMLDIKEPHGEPIDCCHNFAQIEHHFGQDIMIHRKGATLARGGTIAVIPGSQGSSSYIVRGKGNKDSFESCSHGAGRKMGRNQARKNLDLEAETKLLDDQGIIHSISGKKQLDEATGAYKDIKKVMADQDDLVEILVTLKPLAVIKG